MSLHNRSWVHCRNPSLAQWKVHEGHAFVDIVLRHEYHRIWCSCCLDFACVPTIGSINSLIHKRRVRVRTTLVLVQTKLVVAQQSGIQRQTGNTWRAIFFVFRGIHFPLIVVDFLRLWRVKPSQFATPEKFLVFNSIKCGC